MTATEQAIQEKELEQLVSLAEAISSKIEELKNSLSDRNKRTSNLKKLLLNSIIMILLLAFYIIIGTGEIRYFLTKNVSFFAPEFLISLISLILGIAILVMFFLFMSDFFSQWRRVQNEITKNIHSKIAQEQKILGELLNMIHSCKELAYQDMSVVSRAVFEMRLNRIHFSAGDNSDSAQFAETVIASIVKNTPFR